MWSRDMQLATDLGYVHTTAADPGKGPGAPRGPSLRLDQTETRRAEKNLFWDRASPLSQGLDDRPLLLSEGMDPPLHYSG